MAEGTGGWKWGGSSPSSQASAFSGAFGGIVSPLLNAWSAAKGQKATAATLFRQSALYAQQGSMLMGSARAYAAGAGAYASGAKSAVQIGKANARNERLRAAKVQPVRDRQLEEAILERRSKVGQGLVEAAANGILLEGRTGAAVAMWEQDEAADLAYQQTLIMQDAEDTIWNLRMSANAKEAEGYGQAAQLYGQGAQMLGQAASAASSAWQSYMQGAYAHQDALAAQRAARKAKRGGIWASLLTGLGTGIGAFFGPAGMMIGTSLGGAAGGVYQAS